MTYEEKKEIADKYLDTLCGLSWDTLPDTNSLHDCESIEDIENACRDRIAEDGDFPFND